MGKGGQHLVGEILDDQVNNSDPATFENNDGVKKGDDGASKKKPRDGSNGGNAKEQESGRYRRPWYVRGGMEVNEVGMGLNVTLPPIFLAATATATALHGDAYITTVGIFAALFVLQASLAYFAHGMRTVFCVVAVPCYMTSLLVLPSALDGLGVVPALALATCIAIWRVGVCMSVCLHRYAAHAAFKCGPVTRFALNVLGCAAHQGGPIWWASMHRRHHKYCDLPRDPHSAIQDGVEAAFSFFQHHNGVDEEFAPKHNDTWWLRLLDTWSFVVCTAEMVMAYSLWGCDGLFVSYTSIWICQTITLWFNVANHPPDHDSGGKACKASNHRAGPQSWYPAFLLLDVLYPYFGAIVSESSHEDHHKHSRLAKRSSTDCAYFSFILPLEMMGLVWDAKVVTPE